MGTMTRLHPYHLNLISTVLLLGLQQFSYVAVNATTFLSDLKIHRYYREVATVVRGGEQEAECPSEDSIDVRKKELECLIRKAQLDPSELLDDTNDSPFSISLKRFLSEARGSPFDLNLICNLQYLNEPNPIMASPQDRDGYMELKKNYMKELDEHLLSAGIDKYASWTETDGNKILIDCCVDLLGSDYLHSSVFTIQNFRQQVVDNPLWKGLIKTAMITLLGDSCPIFDEIIKDNDLWSFALLNCLR